jgi:glucokinase
MKLYDMNQEILFKCDFFIDNTFLYTIVYDIGGTNCNAGLFAKEGHGIRPLLMVRYKSHEFQDPYQMICAFQQYIVGLCGLFPLRAIIIAGAGFVSNDSNRIMFSNLSLTLEKDSCKTISLFKCSIIFMNDFEVIWHGISLINASNLVLLSNVSFLKNGMVGIIGAGTGLGKSIVGFNRMGNSYSVFRSEGGHQAFSVWTEQEYELMRYISKEEQRKCMITWEDLLSGNGISRIYHFFLKKYPNLLALNKPYPHPDEIFNERFRDQVCLQTYNLYIRLYARCIREFALEILPFGGLYIAGGIAAHNVDMFKSDIFMQEFLSHEKHKKVLELVPLMVITDYNVSLYGAAWVGLNNEGFNI